MSLQGFLKIHLLKSSVTACSETLKQTSMRRREAVTGLMTVLLSDDLSAAGLAPTLAIHLRLVLLIHFV